MKTTPPTVEELEKKYGNIIGWYELKGDIEKALTQTRKDALREALEVVRDYEKRMTELHNKMIGITLETSKIMLAYDMHSRLIATKHIKEALTTLIEKKGPTE